MYRLDIPGWLPEADLQLLAALAAAVPPGGRILEVGAYLGRSAWCLSRSAHPEVSVRTLDLFDPAQFRVSPELQARFPGADLRCTLENFQAWTHGCQNLAAQQVGHEERPELEERFDLVFLDAHTVNPYVKRDLRHYLTLLKPGGVLAGNGYAGSNDVAQEVNAFVAAAGCAFERHGGSRLWICRNVGEQAIRELGLPGGDASRGLRREMPEDALAMEREFDALLSGSPKPVEAEAVAINRVVAQCPTPTAFIDLGCWAGALSCKVVEKCENVDRVLLVDASVSLTVLAHRKVAERIAKLRRPVQVKSWSRTIALRADEEPKLIATRGATLINTSLLRAPGEDAFLLNAGPVLTPQGFVLHYGKSLDGGYLKIDINGYEYRVIDEVVAQGRTPVAIHTKVSYSFERTFDALLKAAEHLGFLRPPIVIRHLKNAVGTCAISRNTIWCEFRDKGSLRPLFTYAEHDGIRNFLGG